MTLTPAQRAQRMRTAKANLAAAHELLNALCDDYSAHGYTLTTSERSDWAAAVRLASALDRMELDQ